MTGGTLLFFFVVLYHSIMAWAWLLSLFGPYQVCSGLDRGEAVPWRACRPLVLLTPTLHAQAIVSALLLVWSTISLFRAFKRVRLPLETATTAPKGSTSASITNGVKQS